MRMLQSYSDVAALSSAELNKRCIEYGIRLHHGKLAKIGLLCQRLSLSTCGPTPAVFTPRERDSGLTPQQTLEFMRLEPAYVESLRGWTKSLDGCPVVEETYVKQFLLDTAVITEASARKYRLTRPYHLKPMVHSLVFNALEESPTFCLVKARCNPSLSTNAADVKSLYAILDKVTGIPYGGYCTCTAGYCQACGHIGAMLFRLVDVISADDHPADATCTDVPCYWSTPKGAAVPPKEFSAIKIRKGKTRTLRRTPNEYGKLLAGQLGQPTEDAWELQWDMCAAMQNSNTVIPAMSFLTESRSVETCAADLHYNSDLPQWVTDNDRCLLPCKVVDVVTSMIPESSGSQM